MSNLSNNSGAPDADTWMTARERYQPHATPAWAALLEQDKGLLASSPMDIAMPLRTGNLAANSEQTHDERAARILAVRAAS